MALFPVRNYAVATLLLVPLLLTDCSAVLNWNLANLQCEPNQNYACDFGYSCDKRDGVFVCITDHSLNTGDTCMLDQQCPVGDVCPTIDFGVCSHTCDLAHIFLTDSGCPDGQYCGAFYSEGSFNDGKAHAAILVGACRQSDACSPGSSCTSTLLNGVEGICAPIGNTAEACVPTCTPSSNASGVAGGDGCGTDGEGNEMYCTPVGEPLNAYLACLSIDNPNNIAAANSPCNGVEAPCQDGQGCINGACSYYAATNVSSCPTDVPYQFCSLQDQVSSTQYNMICGSGTTNACGYCYAGNGGCP